MKKKLILFSFIITLSLTAIVASSMTEAIIDLGYCYGCGDCWSEKGEPYFEHYDSFAWWGEFQTGEQWDLRFYAYPTGDHQLVILAGKSDCPAQCIYTW